MISTTWFFCILTKWLTFILDNPVMQAINKEVMSENKQLLNFSFIYYINELSDLLYFLSFTFICKSSYGKVKVTVIPKFLAEKMKLNEFQCEWALKPNPVFKSTDEQKNKMNKKIKISKLWKKIIQGPVNANNND